MVENFTNTSKAYMKNLLFFRIVCGNWHVSTIGAKRWLFLHYIPRTISVRPHQVTYFIRTSDALIRINFCMLLFNDVRLNLTFNIRAIQRSDAFYNTPLFFHHVAFLCTVIEHNV